MKIQLATSAVTNTLLYRKLHENGICLDKKDVDLIEIDALLS